MNYKYIAIYAAGGFGREAAWLAEECSDVGRRFKLACFIDDNPKLAGKIVNTLPVLTLEQAIEKFSGLKISVAAGIPLTKEKIVEKVKAAGLEFETLVHPDTRKSPWVEFGTGSIICAGNIFTTNVKVGQHVHVNPMCTVMHDVILGDYTTLTPGVHVAGWVHFGKRVFVGTGAVFVNGTEDKPLLIGHDAVIGAGAVVTKDVPAGVTVVGVPARVVSRGP